MSRAGRTYEEWAYLRHRSLCFPWWFVSVLRGLPIAARLTRVQAVWVQPGCVLWCAWVSPLSWLLPVDVLMSW